MDDLSDDLAAYLEAIGDGTAPPPDGTFDDLDAPVDTRDVNRLLRARERMVKQMTEIDGLAQAEHDRIQAWMDDRMAGPSRAVGAIDRALEGWARSVNEQTGIKTWKLPNGTIKLTAGVESVVVDDEAALIEYAIGNDERDLIKTTYSPVKTALKALTGRLDLTDEEAAGSDPDVIIQHVTTSYGEVVPGVHVEKPRHPKFHPPKP